MATINQLVRGLPLVWEALKYVGGHQSVLGLSPTQVYVFWKSDPALDNVPTRSTMMLCGIAPLPC